jgi:hypothetical protein
LSSQPPQTIATPVSPPSIPPSSAPTISNTSINASSQVNRSTTAEAKAGSGVPLLVSFSLQKELAKSSSSSS